MAGVINNQKIFLCLPIVLLYYNCLNKKGLNAVPDNETLTEFLFLLKRKSTHPSVANFCTLHKIYEHCWLSMAEHRAALIFVFPATTTIRHNTTAIFPYGFSVSHPKLATVHIKKLQLFQRGEKKSLHLPNYIYLLLP